MSEQIPQPSKDIEQISRDLGDEAQALSEIHDQGLSPEDQETWDALVKEHQANYAANSQGLDEMTKRKVNEANSDLRARQESRDHNAR